MTAILLLVGHTAAYKLYEPGTLPPPPDVRHAETNAEAKAATALDPVWRPNDNFGRQLDARLHLPPTSGYYVTFNAISSAATILFGILVGELLRSAASPTRKIYVLLGAGLCGLAFGWAISGGGGWIPFEFTPIVPLVKKIWTASFAIFSAGWTCLGMALFYAVIDVAGWKAWAFPFVVVGMNSIAMSVLSGTMRSNFRIVANMFVPIAPIPDRPGPRLCDYMPVVDLSTWQWHFGVDLTGWYLTPFVGSSIVMLCFWLCTYAMYRNKIFLKV